MSHSAIYMQAAPRLSGHAINVVVPGLFCNLLIGYLSDGGIYIYIYMVVGIVFTGLPTRREMR